MTANNDEDTLYYTMLYILYWLHTTSNIIECTTILTIQYWSNQVVIATVIRTGQGESVNTLCCHSDHIRQSDQVYYCQYCTGSRNKDETTKFYKLWQWLELRVSDQRYLNYFQACYQGSIWNYTVTMTTGEQRINKREQNRPRIF